MNQPLLMGRRAMSRTSIVLALALLLTHYAVAKDKNKLALQAYVLNAQTVLVVINPEAGEPLTDPTANRRAREDVERALMKWGRFHLVMESQTADLVLAVRKGTGRRAACASATSAITTN
jgi:hypothetical protein